MDEGKGVEEIAFGFVLSSFRLAAFSHLPTTTAAKSTLAMAPPPCPYLAPPLSTFYPPGPPNPRPHFSYEFFPPLTQPGTLNLHDRIHRMASLGPAAVSVTWGAGGSTSDRSLGLAKFVAEEVRGGRKADQDVECILHLTCTNMERSTVVAALDVSRKRAQRPRRGGKGEMG